MWLSCSISKSASWYIHFTRTLRTQYSTAGKPVTPKNHFLSFSCVKLIRVTQRSFISLSTWLVAACTANVNFQLHFYLLPGSLFHSIFIRLKVWFTITSEIIFQTFFWHNSLICCFKIYQNIIVISPSKKSKLFLLDQYQCSPGTFKRELRF